MLARATVSIGLEVNRPPSPEPSRLDDWFLGAGRCSQPRRAFLPGGAWGADEVVDGPFTARSRSSASSILTTLDGGVARGYAGIPQVERAIAVHLCPRNATTWRNRPRLPSKACRLTAALAAKAYSAAGQAASALHVMAILQVHQAKALKQVHEGSTDPGLMQELRSATDFALRATKVTARSLGTLSRGPHLPGRAVWQHSRGLCPAVLGGTAADWGDPAHPAPAWCTIHRCPQGQASVCPSPWAPSCVLQSCSAPGRIAGERRPPTQRGWNLLFLRRRREQRRSFPRWRAGRRIFRFCSAAGPRALTSSYPRNVVAFDQSSTIPHCEWVLRPSKPWVGGWLRPSHWPMSHLASSHLWGLERTRLGVWRPPRAWPFKMFVLRQTGPLRTHSSASTVYRRSQSVQCSISFPLGNHGYICNLETFLYC